jgi:sulfide:quinone oxidoreductase
MKNDKWKMENQYTSNWSKTMMARVVIIGGGFGGVIAAESLARRLGPEHQVTLVSRHREFTFFPALVRLAFGRCALGDVFYDLEESMLRRRVEFIQAETLSVEPGSREILALREGREIKLMCDFLVFALGRGLALERVPGLTRYAHHPLTVGDALRFGEAVKSFERGHAVIGYCPDSRLSVPTYETAFALDRALRERGRRDRTRISIVAPGALGALLRGDTIAPPLRAALEKRDIDFIPDFYADFIDAERIYAKGAQSLAYDLLTLTPPFQGLYDTQFSEVTDREGYVHVDEYMRSTKVSRFYAVGDAVSFPGPKMAHMAVLQAEVAAANITAEIEGQPPEAKYDHQMMTVIDAGGGDSIYLRHNFWEDETMIMRGRFWGWAKQTHEKYWTRLHSLKPITNTAN